MDREQDRDRYGTYNLVSKRTSVTHLAIAQLIHRKYIKAKNSNTKCKRPSYHDGGGGSGVSVG